MRGNDSDNFITDNEESEVSMKQTIEANGESIDKEVLIHGGRKSRAKSCVYH